MMFHSRRSWRQRSIGRSHRVAGSSTRAEVEFPRFRIARLSVHMGLLPSRPQVVSGGRCAVDPRPKLSGATPVALNSARSRRETAPRVSGPQRGRHRNGVNSLWPPPRHWFIINYPEVAILGMGRARETPVYRNDMLTKAMIMPLFLSFDHCATDGANAARFTREMIGYLETPTKLLLD